jgi:adenylate cyclase
MPFGLQRDARRGVIPLAIRTNRQPPMKPCARTSIGDWIVRAALAGANEVEIVAGTCEQLCNSGVRLVRSSVATNLLDPTIDARGVRWLRGEGAREEMFDRRDDGTTGADWARSPFFFMIERGEPMLRRRLDASYSRGEFPLLDTFQDQRVTDYLAFAMRIGKGVQFGESEGMVASWTTDAPSGFEAAQAELIEAIMPALTLAFMLRTMHRSARALITTYLGTDAAERVLAGNIVRGRAEAIRAVVWLSDLVGFTRLSETTEPGELLRLLNDYAEAQVEAIEGHGGHVLKFMGDGMLAIFPGDNMAAACGLALAAAADQRQRILALNERRRAAGQPTTGTHLALHVGELRYGNIGSPRRLDFTVLGPAVNEAARIETLCASLEQAVIVSQAFAETAGESRHRLVSLGRYAMKGVARSQELLTLDPG